MVWIEKYVTKVTDQHHEASLVMPNSDLVTDFFVTRITDQHHAAFTRVILKTDSG